jgi:hypothetical protein
MANGFGVLRDALVLCRRHPELWLTAGLMSLPMTVVTAISGPLGQWPLIPAPLRDSWPASLSPVVLAVVQLLVLMISAGVVTLAVARAVAGRPASTSTAWQLGLGRIRPAITASLAMILPAIGWGLLIAAPAFGVQAALRTSHPQLGQAIGYTGAALYFLFISVRYCTLYGVAMVQRTGGFEGVDRALGLQAGQTWTVAAAVLPIELVRHGLQAAADRLPAVGANAGNELVNWLLLPIETAAAVLLYVRLRAERDGLSRQALNEQLSS